MSISETLLPEFDQEMASTRKLLERVPVEKPDWKPHEKSMPLGRLAGHVAELPGWAVNTIQLESMNFEPGQFKPFIARSRDELLAMFDKNVDEARTAIAGATDDHLARTWTVSISGKPMFAMPRSAVLRNMVMNHLIHHRAQLGVYLRLNNVAVPGMYGPSADEPNMFAAPAS